MGRRLWGVFVVLVLAAAAGYFVYRLRDDRTHEGATIPVNTRRELSERVIRTLEVDDSAGRVVLAPARRLCAARVFGAEPLRAQQTADVETVYAQVLCVEVKPDNTAGTERAVPIAMHLGSKVRVQVPREGSSYGDDVKKIFPSRLRHAAARDAVVERDLRTDVDRRLRDLPPAG